MIWCELTATTPLDQIEAVAQAIRSVVPTGVSIEEPLIPLGPEEGVRLDRRRPALVKAYLPVDDRLGERLAAIDAALGAVGLHPPLQTRHVEEEDWADAWKEFFHVERFGERIVVRPSWREYTPGPDDIVIDLDPGMAFGTGQHPTTRMCLEFVEQVTRPGLRVLDVGTGSGILAIAALKLGAASCAGCDTEPVSIRVARENAERNRVAAAFDLWVGTVGEPNPLTPFPAREGGTERRAMVIDSFLPVEERSFPAGSFDLALANITAGAVAGLAPALGGVLTAGGRLVASGIIGERLDEVLTALAAAGFTINEARAEGDWRALLATRS